MLFFHDHSKGLEPVANNVPWYYITLAIGVGAAALQHGVHMVFASWERELKLPAWFSVAGDIFGIVLATGLGALTGHLVWNWALGGVVGLVGAFSSSLVLSLVRARLGAAKDALKDAASEEPKK